mmetsp:Transcript_26043/g.82310  ORF Transcript_26043/g.82310 Transcript_26043/m.82310 type:complete len:208 (+) Transcript_26043:1023-1646(+)
MQQQHRSEDREQEHQAVCHGVPELLRLEVAHYLDDRGALCWDVGHAAVDDSPAGEAHQALRSVEADGAVGNIEASDPTPASSECQGYKVHKHAAAFGAQEVAPQVQHAERRIMAQPFAQVNQALVVNAGSLQVQLLKCLVHAQDISQDTCIRVACATGAVGRGHMQRQPAQGHALRDEVVHRQQATLVWDVSGDLEALPAESQPNRD